MDVPILIVGERRSPLARKMRLRWEDGGLAAKPLFEALRAAGIDPAACRFVNWFEGGKTVTRRHRGVVVALGKKVQAALVAESIPFVALVHPAARGLIRRRERYLAHVAERLRDVPRQRDATDGAAAAAAAAIVVDAGAPEDGASPRVRSGTDAAFPRSPE